MNEHNELQYRIPTAEPEYNPVRLTSRGKLVTGVALSAILAMGATEATGITDINGNTITCEGTEQYLATPQGLHGVAERVDAPDSVPTAAIVDVIESMNQGTNLASLGAHQQVVGPKSCN